MDRKPITEFSELLEAIARHRAIVEVDNCQKCGSPLDSDGLCTNPICFFYFNEQEGG